jgi:hypothetical protein
MKWFKTIYWCMGILLLVNGFTSKNYIQIAFGLLFIFAGVKAIK